MLVCERSKPGLARITKKTEVGRALKRAKAQISMPVVLDGSQGSPRRVYAFVLEAPSFSQRIVSLYQEVMMAQRVGLPLPPLSRDLPFEDQPHNRKPEIPRETAPFPELGRSTSPSPDKRGLMIIQADSRARRRRRGAVVSCCDVHILRKLLLLSASITASIASCPFERSSSVLRTGEVKKRHQGRETKIACKERLFSAAFLTLPF